MFGMTFHKYSLEYVYFSKTTDKFPTAYRLQLYWIYIYLHEKNQNHCELLSSSLDEKLLNVRTFTNFYRN